MADADKRLARMPMMVPTAGLVARLAPRVASQAADPAFAPAALR